MMTLIETLLRTPQRPLSNDEVELLLVEPERPLLVDKVLAVHLFKAGDLNRALELAQVVLAQEPNSENAKNVMHIMTKTRAFDAAIAFAKEHHGLFEPIIFEDMMCMLFNAMGDVPQAVAHGTRSLEMKDAAAGEVSVPDFTLTPFDPNDRSRNVIAMSLYGDDLRYFIGARNNIVVSRYLYPGWTLRIYVDSSITPEMRAELTREGAQVLEVGNWPAETHGLFWRFLVEDDETVDTYLIRDADSVMNLRERMAVEDWLEADRAFHVMRDNPQHSEMILAGMWGARRGNIGGMQERIKTFLAKAPVALNNVTLDQQFLRNEIWPIVKHSVLCHDTYLGFGETRPFPRIATLPQHVSVGENDWVNYRPGSPP
ncbi:MAG: hypothetical protein AAF580_08385 [Pseudomonadota bacterium]